MRARAARTPLPWLAGLAALYLVVPVVAFVVRLLASGGAGLGAPGLGSAVAVSFATATISTVVAALVGVPLAYLLARSDRPWSRALGACVQLPLALPPLMSGILLLYLVGPQAPLGRLFGGRLTDSLAGIVLAQTFVASPFLIVAARSAFASLDRGLMEVAATQGVGEWARFVKVGVPAALPGIGAGAVLCWLRAFGEFGATVILAYHPYSLPVFTYVQFGSTGLSATLGPTAAALLSALAVLAAFRWRPRIRPARPPRHLPPPAVPAACPPRAPAWVVDERLGSFRLSMSYDAASPRVAILGESGAGKSTALRALAGLTTGGHSRLRLGDRDLAGVPAEHRHIGYVPQDATLLPHLDVWRQVQLGPRSDPGAAALWLERLQLAALASRLPNQLSGGQRRRVALARALSCRPELVLLDEPFSSLDAPVRDELRRQFRRLQRETGLPTVLVTHDPEEAALLGDDIVVLGDGRILQAGSRADVFARPASPDVARLLGIANHGRGVVVDDATLEVFGLPLAASTGVPAGTPVSWCLRPEHVRVGEEGSYPGVVLDWADLGSSTEILVELAGGTSLRARVTPALDLSGHTDVRVSIPPDAFTIWPLS